MHRTPTALTAALLAGALLTGCAGTSGSADDTPAAGSNRPTETAAPAEEAPTEEAPAEEPTEDAAPGPVTFGQAYTYEDGLSITIGQPVPFTPSDTSAGAEGAAAVVAFDVTIVNGTSAPFDPSGMYVTMQSANTEASEVFDSAQGIEGSPSTSLLAGREAKYRTVWAVANPADLVMEVTPGFDYQAAIFTNSQ